MAGIVLESIAACRRATYSFRILRASQRPFVHCPSVATLQHRCRRYSSSDGPADENGKDQLNPMKPIHLGQGQLAKDSDGSQVIAAPPDPKDSPGEKRTELPYEVRPEIPMETQPNRVPLEIKPPNPLPIICTTDNETLNYTDKAAKGEDLNKESEAKPYISNDLLPPPVINLMDDQTPYPTTSEPEEFIESPYISVDSDVNYPPMGVNAFVNSEVASELASQGSSSNDPKTEVAESQNEASENVETPLTTQTYSKPNSSAPGSGASLDLKVKPQEGNSNSQSSPLAAKSELSSRQEPVAVGSGWSQSSSFNLPGEGQISGPEAKVEPIIYSSAKDGYGNQNDQILGKDQEVKKAPTADKIREHVVDNEVIDQWVDKFKRLYMAEKAAFGLDNEKENVDSSDKKNSDSKDEKDKKHSKTMLMDDNKWVYENKDNATPSSSTTDNSSPKDQTRKNSFPSMVKKDNKWVFEKNDTTKASSPQTVESSPAGALPANIEAKQEAPEDEKFEPPILTMVLKDTQWVLENKYTAEKVTTPSDTDASTTNTAIRSSHEGDYPQDIAELQKASSNKSNEQPSPNKVMEDTKSAIENTVAAEKLSTTNDKTSPEGALPLNIEAKHDDSNDQKEPTSMVKRNNVWVSRNKTAKPEPSPGPTFAFDPEGTLPLNIGGKQEPPTEVKESKRDIDTSDKNAKIDISNTAEPKPPSLGPTLAFDPEGTLPLNIGGKQEPPTELKESKKEIYTSDKNDKIDTSNLAFDPEGTSPLNIGGKQEPPTEVKESKKEVHTSDVNANLDTSKNTAEPEPPSTGPTLIVNPAVTLPLNISAQQESPTEFKGLEKDLHATDMNSNLGTSSNSINLILGQPPASATSDTEISESATGDFQKSTEEIFTTFDDNRVQSPSDFTDFDHDKSINQTTEEIVALFKQDYSDELIETEESETFLESTMGSQSDVLGMSDDKYDQARTDKDADDYFSELLDFEESTNSHVDAKAQHEDQFISSSVDMETSKLDTTFKPTNINLAEEDSSFVKAAKDSDSGEIDAESMSSTEDFDSHTEKLDTTFEPTNLAEEDSSLVKAAKDSDSSEIDPESMSSTEDFNSHTESTAMLPDGVHDPISNEVSTSAPMEAAELKESEDLAPDHQVPEVTAKTDENQAMEETNTKDTEIASTEEKPEKKKPELEHGELSMKLLDKESAEEPTSASEVLKPTEKPSPAQKIPTLGAESQTAGEKSLIQKLFDKILGGRGKNDGKRQMSTYTIQRQLSTSCAFGIPSSFSPNGVKVFRRESPVRTFVTMGLVHEDNQELKPNHEASSLVLDFFAKNTDDLTEIKGGSPSCSSPKKSPRDLLREKNNSKKIKILGGSEECAKKMKRIKEQTNATEDDCERDTFSISQIFRQLLDILLSGHPTVCPPCLFLNTKGKMRGQRYSSPENAVKAFKTHVLEVPQSEWKKCFEWFECMQKCII